MFDPKKIKVIVWDVDGTWYRFIPAFSEEGVNNRLRVLVQKKNISFDEAKKLYEETKKKTISSPLAIAELTGMSVVEVLSGVDGKVDRSKYLKKDRKLLQMFDRLKDFRHAVVSNISRKTFCRTVELLGLSEKIFEYVLTTDDSGEVKPSLGPFRMVLKKTGFRPDNHLVVGDRESLDIIPAKKLGMQTCFVWGKSKLADVSIDEVYLLTDALKKF